MHLSMRKFLISISWLLLTSVLPIEAQSLFPDSVGQKQKYAATIEMKKGYISGICMMANEGEVVKGCLFNEFGISAIDFSYRPTDGKVKLLGVIKMLDKWYIKRVLRRDLALLMQNLRMGKEAYRDEKYKIDYKFTILNDATEE